MWVSFHEGAEIFPKIPKIKRGEKMTVARMTSHPSRTRLHGVKLQKATFCGIHVPIYRYIYTYIHVEVQLLLLGVEIKNKKEWDVITFCKDNSGVKNCCH